MKIENCSPILSSWPQGGCRAGRASGSVLEALTCPASSRKTEGWLDSALTRLRLILLGPPQSSCRQLCKLISGFCRCSLHNIRFPEKRRRPWQTLGPAPTWPPHFRCMKIQSFMTHSETLPKGKFKFNMKSKLSFKQGLKPQIRSVKNCDFSFGKK